MMMRFDTKPNYFGRGTVRVCRRGESILLVALSRLERFNAFNDDGTTMNSVLPCIDQIVVFWLQFWFVIAQSILSLRSL